MSARVAAAALQYSKWLSRFISWCWILYRFAALAAGVIRPEAAEAFASTLINLDWIMLVNEGTYLINSLGEKYIFSDKFIVKWLDKGGFNNVIAKFNLFSKNRPQASNSEDMAEDDDNDEDLAGGEEDGDNICG